MRTRRKNVFHAVIAILLILSLLSGGIMVSADSEIRYSTDLSEFLTNWQLTVGDQVYGKDCEESSVIEYRKDVLYQLSLVFEERHDLQFETNGKPLTFPLPTGFRVRDDFSMMMNVNLGKWGTLSRNPITYDKSTNMLVLQWNTDDTEHMMRFRDSSSAVIRMTLSGTLGSEETEVFAIDEKTFPLMREDPHNASVTKEGTYDPVRKQIDYRVSVLSDGTTSDLTLTDTMGSALTYCGDIRFESTGSVNTAQTTPVITQRTGNTFSVRIPSMNHQDKLVFSYSASVDPDRIAHSGNATFEETGNTARIFGDSYPSDNTATYHESLIEFSDLVKNSVGVTSEYRDGVGYSDIEWEIVTNKDCLYPLSGTAITDTIDPDMQEISSYYGEGVTVLCYRDQDLAERRFLTWEELGVDPLRDKSWTYHIPETDPVYQYTLRYRTTVRTDHQQQSFVVKNTAEGKGGIDSAYEVLNPIGGNLGIAKTAAEVTSDSVTWEIRIHLKDQAFERQQLILTEHQNSQKVNGKVTWQSDHLPYKWLNPNNQTSTLYKETLDTLEVTGLYENETFVLNYGHVSSEKPVPDRHPAGSQRILTADESWHSDKWNPEKLSIEFFRDPDATQGGLNRPSDGSNERTITVRLKTKFPEEWAQQAKQQNINRWDNSTWYYEHLNWADIEGVYDVAKIAPYPIGVYKRVLRDASAATSKETNMVRNGRIYPVYYYQVLVCGVDSDTPLVIDDCFDTRIFQLYEPHSDRQMSERDFLNGGVANSWDNWFYTKYGGINEFDWIKPELGTCLRLDEDPDHILSQEMTDTGVRFTFHQIPKDQNHRYYKFYGVEYWLVPKDEAALKIIEDMAASSPTGEAILINTASCRGEEARARVALKSLNDFTPIEKNAEQFIEYTDGTRSTPEQRDDRKPIYRYGLKYRVDLNRDQSELNGGADIVAEDRYSSNLSVDFQTIRIHTEPANRQVSYDFSGNVGRFIIPDKTHVVIEYETTLIAPLRQNSGGQPPGDSISVENTVTMLHYHKTRTDSVDYNSSAESSAQNPSIFIKKYERGHMESGLNGAVFQLFRYKPGASGNSENDWEPMVYADTYSPTGEGRIPNPDRGKIITFTTGNLTIAGKNYGDGYADVELTNTVHGLNLEYHTTYGLREIQVPVRTADNGEIIRYQNPHNASFYCYKFTLTKSTEDVDYSQFIFRPDEIMTVKNDPDSIGFRLKKKFDGNCELSETEKNQLSYQLYVQKTSGGQKKYMPVMTTIREHGIDRTIVNPNFVNIRYQTLLSQDGGYRIDGLHLEEGSDSGRYLLVERCSEEILNAHPDWQWKGCFEWDSGSSGSFSSQQVTVYDENGRNPQQVYGVAFEITEQDVLDNDTKTLTLTNRYVRETVDLTVEKKWISPSGAAGSWPVGKTMTLELGTVRNGNFVSLPDVPDVVLDHQTDHQGEEKPGTAVFRNLPKYVQGTSDQRIVYAVREISSPEGYHVVYPQNGKSYAVFGDDHTAVIRNQVDDVSVTVRKQWQSKNGQIPSGAKSVMRLYAYPGTDAEKAVWVSNVSDIELDGVSDQNGEREAWTAAFRNLPKYNENGVLLTYLVKEQSCEPSGYSALEGAAEDGGTITNSPAVTSFSVTKTWQGTDNDEWPDDTEITFVLHRRIGSGASDDRFLAEYTLNRNEIVSRTDLSDWAGNPVSVSWNGSELTLNGLPRYSDDGKAWVYYLTESPLTDFTVDYRNDKGYRLDGMTYSGGSVRNIRSVRELTIAKQVSGRLASQVKSFDFTVTLLHADQDIPVTDEISYLKTNADGSQISGTLTCSSEGKAVFRLSHQESIRLLQLPSRVRYTVEETGDADGYTTTVCVNEGSAQQTRRIQGVLSEDAGILFENRRDGMVPTSADDVIPVTAAVISGVSVLCLLVWLGFRRLRQRSLPE